MCNTLHVCVSLSHDNTLLSTALCCATGCTLHYQDVNVTALVPPGAKVLVCNEAWASFAVFNQVAYLQPSERYNGVLIPAKEAAILEKIQYVVQDGSLLIPIEQRIYWQMNCTFNDTSLIPMNSSAGGQYIMQWGAICSNGAGKPGVITKLNINFLPNTGKFVPSAFVPQLTEELGLMLLNLEHLQWLHIEVLSGTIPPQLGALKSLKTVWIMHYCLTGPLPTYLISEWRGLEDLQITRTLIGGINYVDPSGGECGVEGPIPAAWFAKESNVTKVDLSHNRLSGG